MIDDPRSIQYMKDELHRLLKPHLARIRAMQARFGYGGLSDETGRLLDDPALFFYKCVQEEAPEWLRQPVPNRIDSDNSVTVRYPSGGASYFKYNSGTFTAPAGVFDTLVKNGDNTYTLTSKAQIQYNFSTPGKLTSIADRNGWTTTVAY